MTDVQAIVSGFITLGFLTLVGFTLWLGMRDL